MSRIKALLFDLDNTLYDYAPRHQLAKAAMVELLGAKLGVKQAEIDVAYRTARTELNRTLDGQAASHSRLLRAQKIIEHLAGRTEAALALEAERVYWQTFLKKIKLRPGIRSLLKTARASGLEIGLVSDLTAQIQFQKIQRLKLDRLIDFVVTSEEAGREKPDPSGVRLILQKLKLTNKEVIFIGDSHHRDRTVAEKLKIRFLPLSDDADVQRVRAELARLIPLR